MTSRPSWDDQNQRAWRAWWHGTPKDELAASFVVPDVGTSISEAAAVMIALAVSSRGTGFVSPNPLVGCVILSKSGQFLSAGAHLLYGEDHAEIQALKQLSQSELQGADVYVTLEPCAHQGKTPPCATKLAQLPLRSVRYLLEDPNPRVRGAGAQHIAAAGISVVCLKEWSDLSEEVMEIFLMDQREHRPFVGMKVASTASGIYALPKSSRHWITGERSRNYGHYLRLRYDGILVGADTVLLDDPALDVRHPQMPSRSPWQFVLDPQGRAWNCDHALKLFDQGNPKSIWFVGCGARALLKTDRHYRGELVELPLTAKGEFEWQSVLKEIFQRDCKSLLIEGGGGVWESAVAAQVADKVHWFVGPDSPDLANGIKWRQPEFFQQRKKLCFKLDQDDYFEFFVR